MTAKTTIDELAEEFATAAEASKAAPDQETIDRIANTGRGVGADYMTKLRRLGSRWRDVLATPAPHDELSETRMALICALTKRNFTDGEVFETLAASAWLADLVRRKGERHAQHLIATEIAKARAVVVPFPPDAPDIPLDLDGIRRRRNGHTNGTHPPDDATHDEAEPDQADAEPRAADHEATTLPLLDAGDGNLPRITVRAWAAVVATNNPPRLFTQGSRPVRLVERDDGITLQELTPERLRHETAPAAAWYRDKTTKGNTTRCSAYPSKDTIANMLAAPAYPLPPLNRIVYAPVFAASGKLITQRGYDADTGIWLRSALRVDVSERPARDDVAAARALIFDDLLVDFPFADRGSAAHAVALMFLQPVRDLIAGPTPLHLIDKPMAGTGAGLLAEALTYPFLGTQLSIMSMARDEENTLKRITAKLCEAPPAILIDNLPPNKRVESEALAAVLTAQQWTDRRLGSNTQTVTVPNRATWIATGNNPRLSDELTRRCVNVHLDAKTERPDARDGFKHPQLAKWAAYHRAELVSAVLTICQHWIARGRPLYRGKLRGSFEAWSEVMGGILECADIDGFLANDAALYERTNDERETWRAFIGAWAGAFGDRPVGIASLYPLVASGDVGFDLGDKGERSQRVKLGNLIKSKRDNIVGDYRIVYAGDVKHAAHWKLEAVNVG